MSQVWCAFQWYNETAVSLPLSLDWNSKRWPYYESTTSRSQKTGPRYKYFPHPIMSLTLPRAPRVSMIIYVHFWCFYQPIWAYQYQWCLLQMATCIFLTFSSNSTKLSLLMGMLDFPLSIYFGFTRSWFTIAHDPIHQLMIQACSLHKVLR